MSGGGGSSSSYRPPVQASAPRVTPVPQNDIQPNWGPAFGAQPVQNPYVAGNAPPWMNGWFGMPSWGMDPFGSPLTQEQMMYQRPQQFDQNMQAQQAPPVAPQQPQQLDPAAQLSKYYQDRYGGSMAGQTHVARRQADDAQRVINTLGPDVARAMGYAIPFPSFSGTGAIGDPNGGSY